MTHPTLITRLVEIYSDKIKREQKKSRITDTTRMNDIELAKLFFFKTLDINQKFSIYNIFTLNIFFETTYSHDAIIAEFLAHNYAHTVIEAEDFLMYNPVLELDNKYSLVWEIEDTKKEYIVSVY